MQVFAKCGHSQRILGPTFVIWARSQIWPWCWWWGVFLAKLRFSQKFLSAFRLHFCGVFRHFVILLFSFSFIATWTFASVITCVFCGVFIKHSLTRRGRRICPGVARSVQRKRSKAPHQTTSSAPNRKFSKSNGFEPQLLHELCSCRRRCCCAWQRSWRVLVMWGCPKTPDDKS